MCQPINKIKLAAFWGKNIYRHQTAQSHGTEIAATLIVSFPM